MHTSLTTQYVHPHIIPSRSLHILMLLLPPLLLLSFPAPPPLLLLSLQVKSGSDVGEVVQACKGFLSGKSGGAAGAVVHILVQAWRHGNQPTTLIPLALIL